MKGFILYSLVFIFVGCNIENSNGLNSDNKLPEIIVYVENGMVPTVLGISKLFESKYPYRVRIHNGDSFTLAGMIDKWGEGDLYIPDSAYGLQILHELNAKIVQDSLFLGFNRLVFYVEKGNPTNFNGDLVSLTDPNQMVILANPETSSLGFATRKLLTQEDLFQKVSGNVMALSIDNRRLISSIIKGDATVTIDWASSYYSPETVLRIDTIHVPGVLPAHEIYATILSTTSNAGMAYSFLAMLSSPDGIALLRKNGINKQRRIDFADVAFY